MRHIFIKILSCLLITITIFSPVQAFSLCPKINETIQPQNEHYQFIYFNSGRPWQVFLFDKRKMLFRYNSLDRIEAIEISNIGYISFSHNNDDKPLAYNTTDKKAVAYLLTLLPIICDKTLNHSNKSIKYVNELIQIEELLKKSIPRDKS